MDSTYTVQPNGTKEWRNAQGQLHRTDGPAFEYNDGSKNWYVNGELHRDNNLPAVEYASGGKAWYLYGQLHRTDGPAIEWATGYKSWHLEDEQLTEEEHRRRVIIMELAGLHNAGP